MKEETKRTLNKVLNEAHKEAVKETAKSLKDKDRINLSFWRRRLIELRKAKDDFQNQ